MTVINTKNIQGKLEVICGPMFSGKSEELIRRLKRAIIAKQKVIAFKHELDKRKSLKEIASHDGRKTKAYPVETTSEIEKLITPDINVICIDEIQFFSFNVVPLIHKFVREGKRVIVSGLDLDFRGMPFGCMPTLMALADSVLKLHAICTLCGNDAHYTQRFVNGKPAKFNDPLIVVGAQECYQARCRACHQIDKFPEFIDIKQTVKEITK